MKFKHIVGNSTFKQGFTIPKKIYPYLSLPEKGHNRKVGILFENNQTIWAKLYRINNKVGHIQVRYENKDGEKLRNWLIETFPTTQNNPNTNVNEYFEVAILNDNLLKIIPFPLLTNNTLCFEDIVTHKINDAKLVQNEHFIEIVDAIRNIKFQQTERQIYYNSEIKRKLLDQNWLSEQPVVNDKRIRLKCDFRKAGFQLEIEFGNARTYYQDLIKFAMSYNAGMISLGGLIVPSTKFAMHLCFLGSMNAIKKSNGKKSQYSGMMDFNKAAIEFDYIKGIFNIPFFIVAIKPVSETWMLSSIQDI
jgi:hypothetical protein